MNAEPHIDAATLCRIGETCERLFVEGTPAANILTALLMVATGFASLVDDRPPDDHRAGEEPGIERSSRHA